MNLQEGVMIDVHSSCVVCQHRCCVVLSRSYLTGFGKRKQARRDKAKAEKKEKEREDVRAMKREQ